MELLLDDQHLATSVPKSIRLVHRCPLLVAQPIDGPEVAFHYPHEGAPRIERIHTAKVSPVS